MREVMKAQPELAELPIGKIKLDLKPRDDIPKLLKGLQYIYTVAEVRNEVFSILQEILPHRADGNKANATLGRRGMDQWKILVLGVVRLGLDADYDRLQELANQHQTLRQMLGHMSWDDQTVYPVQTLKDNLQLFSPEMLDRINQVVVRAGHNLVKKSPDDVLRGRCDSFVVETNVHFPTDTNVLLDAIRKSIDTCAKLAEEYELSGWRQSAYLQREFKKSYRTLQKCKHSSSKDESKRQAKQEEAQTACREYLKKAEEHLDRAR